MATRKTPTFERLNVCATAPPAPVSLESKVWSGSCFTLASRALLRVVRLCHCAVVERFVQHVLLDTRLPGHLTQRAPGGSRLLDDLSSLVVADVRIQCSRSGKGELGVALARLSVRLDAFHALLCEKPGGARQKADRLEQVPGEKGDEYVQLEVPLHPADGDGGVVPDHLRRDLRHDFGDDRVHLPRHDRASLLELRQRDLRKAGP